MSQDYIHLSVLVDRSGSMSSIASDMIGGLETFFKSQAALPGECRVDYAQFDNEYEKVTTDALVASVKPILEPRGGTALLDALGKTITDLDAKFKAADHKPDKVFVVVVTDGYENASREFSKAGIKKLVEDRQKEFDWEFIFLGANMDAITEGGSFGFSSGSSLTYTPSTVGVTYGNLSSYVTRSRTGASSGFTEDERNASLGK